MDVYGYEKTTEDSTRKTTLVSITGRKLGSDKGDSLSLFNGLRKDLCPLFPSIFFYMPSQQLDVLAHIEIGKKDKFYSAGIVVVKELNNTTIGANKKKAITYAKIDRYSLGTITDGYEFLVFVENPLTGFWNAVSMDYAHFAGKLIRNLCMAL